MEIKETVTAAVTQKWTDLKTQVMKSWSEITHDELDLTGGNLQSVIALVEKKVGLAREEAATKLMELAALVEGDQSATSDASVTKH